MRLLSVPDRPNAKYVTEIMKKGHHVAPQMGGPSPLSRGSFPPCYKAPSLFSKSPVYPFISSVIYSCCNVPRLENWRIHRFSRLWHYVRAHICFLLSYLGPNHEIYLSSVRFIVFDQHADIVAQHQLEFPQYYPHPGYVTNLSISPLQKPRTLRLLQLART